MVPKMERAKFREFEFDWPKALFNECLEVAWARYEALDGGQVHPAREGILRALRECSFDECSVVVVGQDPYHGPGQADGLAFSVPRGVKLPPSLRNIYKEMQSCGYDVDWDCGDLSFLSRNGFLLLNSSLTVLPGKPMSHADLGWSQWTDQLIEYISDHKSGVKFLLWGKFAQSKRDLIDTSKHIVLETSHPSPLSAYRGFLGSGCFEGLL